MEGQRKEMEMEGASQKKGEGGGVGSAEDNDTLPRPPGKSNPATFCCKPPLVYHTVSKSTISYHKFKITFPSLTISMMYETSQNYQVVFCTTESLSNFLQF